MQRYCLTLLAILVWPPGLTKAQSETIPIIDVHTHTSFTGGTEPTTGRPRTMDQYFKEWREAGIVGAVAHTTADGGNFQDLASRNVIYCGGVGDRVDLKRIEDGLRSKQYKCIKIYLGYTHRYAYDRQYEPFYALAQKYEPVVFHTGDAYSKTAKLK